MVVQKAGLKADDWAAQLVVVTVVRWAVGKAAQ